MKILHVYRTYFPDPPGGLQEAIRQIAVGAQSLGAESRIFTLSPLPNPPTIDRPEGLVVRARSWAAPASCDLGSWGALTSYRKQLCWADIVHFHFPWPFADMLNLSSPTHKPKVMTYHSDIVKQQFLGKFYYPLVRHTLGQMDAVVATSPTYAKTSPMLSKHVEPSRLHVIPLCMQDQVPAYLRQPPSDIVERLDLANKPFVLALGVLRYYKGLHHLVNAAQQIQGKVVIAGSGPEQANLYQLVQHLGIDNIVFAGQVTHHEKHTLLANTTALVLASHMRSEAFGMVLLEAAMHSKPLVCCEIGTGTSWVNQHGYSGWVVPPNNPRALANAINRLIQYPAHS
jgi:rhamnosyl/mannosyltransferase